jgi:ribosome recycling factor
MGANAGTESGVTEKEMQKLTDDHIKLIDDTLKHKEKEIMEV